MSIASEQALLQRQEAKRLLSSMFNIPEGYGNGSIDRIVDCIISAALLEVAVMMDASMKER